MGPDTALQEGVAGAAGVAGVAGAAGVAGSAKSPSSTPFFVVLLLGTSLVAVC